VCYAGGAPPNFVCFHAPMEIFLFYEMRKKGGNKKRVVYTRGGSFMSACVLLREGHLRA